MTQENKDRVDKIQSALIDDIEDLLASNSAYDYRQVNEAAQVLLTLEKAKGVPQVMNWGTITSVSDNGELNITQEGND